MNQALRWRRPSVEDLLRKWVSARSVHYLHLGTGCYLLHCALRRQALQRVHVVALSRNVQWLSADHDQVSQDGRGWELTSTFAFSFCSMGWYMSIIYFAFLNEWNAMCVKSEHRSSGDANTVSDNRRLTSFEPPYQPAALSTKAPPTILPGCRARPAKIRCPSCAHPGR